MQFCLSQYSLPELLLESPLTLQVCVRASPLVHHHDPQRMNRFRIIGRADKLLEVLVFGEDIFERLVHHIVCGNSPCANVYLPITMAIRLAAFATVPVKSV